MSIHVRRTCAMRDEAFTLSRLHAAHAIVFNMSETCRPTTYMYDKCLHYHTCTPYTWKPFHHFPRTCWIFVTSFIKIALPNKEFASCEIGHLFRHVTNQPPKANSAFHPSGVGKWVPASAGNAKAGMVHSVSGWTQGVQDCRSLENACHTWAP